MLHLDLLLAVHPGPQALGDRDGHLRLVPPVLEDGRQDPGHGEGGAVHGPRVRLLAAAALAAAHAGGEAARLVVAADAGARDLAPAVAEALGGARGEEGLDVDLAGGRGAEVGGRHLEDAAVQAEGGEDLGLRVDHLVEDVGRRVGVGRRPREELDLGELVHAVQALRLGAAGARLGAVAPRRADALGGELGGLEHAVDAHAGQRDLGGAGEAELGLPAGGVGRGLRDGVDLGLVVLVARLEPAGRGHVAVHDARGRDLAPARYPRDGRERIGDEGLLELGALVQQVVPSPAGRRGGRGEVEDAQLGPDVHVRAPDAVRGRPGGLLKGMRLVYVAQHAWGVAARGVVGRQVRDGEGEVGHLGGEAGFVLLDGRQRLLE